MKSRLLITALTVALLAFSGIAGHIPQANAAEQKTDAERKKYLDEQKRKIDREAEREIDRVLDGQKGLGNSGASQRKIAEIERQREARKKALDDHYRQGRGNVVGLDGKRKGADSSRNVVGLDGKRTGSNTAAVTPKKPSGTTAPTPAKTPRYVVGMDGKRKLVTQ